MKNFKAIEAIEMEKKNIFYIVGIAAILVIVFLSQQGYLAVIGSAASGALSGYWAKGSGWATDKVYSTISDEVQKRGEIIGNEINSEKEKISENVLQKVGDYISGIADSVLHPGDDDACAAQPE